MTLKSWQRQFLHNLQKKNNSFEDLKRWYQLIFFLLPLVVHSFTPFYLLSTIVNKTYNSSQFHDIFVHFFKVFPDFKSGATVYSRQRVHFRGRAVSYTPESKNGGPTRSQLCPGSTCCGSQGQRPRLLYNWDVVCAQHLGRATTLLLIWEPSFEQRCVIEMDFFRKNDL